MKIAVITSGNQYDRKGLFNNVNERIRQLKKIDGIQIDAYIIQFSRNRLLQFLRRETGLQKQKYFEVDGVKYQSILLRLRFIDSLFISKLKIRAFYQKKKLLSKAYLFREYDLLSTHTPEASLVALEAKRIFSIPYVITWHGTDIHTSPFSSKIIFKETKKLIENADYNFFVSKNLMDISNLISNYSKKDVLYSGPSSRFKKYSIEEIKLIKKKKEVSDKIVIAYVGNLVPVKNVMILPEIFGIIQKNYSNVIFWIIGDGTLRIDLEKKCSKFALKVMFLGNIEPENMSDYFNCIDIIVLPSIKEGLPRTTLEALACGTHIVGSNAGGISEVIGEENSFDLKNDFVNNISKRMVKIISENLQVKTVPVDFNWDKTLQKEIGIYKQILNVKNSIL